MTERIGPGVPYDSVSELQALASRSFAAVVRRYSEVFENRTDATTALCTAMQQAVGELEAHAVFQAATVPDRYKLGDPLDDEGRAVAIHMAAVLMPLAEIAYLCRVPLVAALEHATRLYEQMEAEGAGNHGH